MLTAECDVESPISIANRKAEVKKFLKALDQPRIAIRTLPDKRSFYHGWEDLDAISDFAVATSPPPENDGQNVYFIVNDVREEDFLALSNGTSDSRAVGAKHISRRWCFYVDIDPTRHSDQSGPMAATPGEREWAEATCERVVMVAALHGFPTPWIVDSGNGFQIYYRLDLPNDDAAGTLIKRTLASFASVFDCDDGHVDASVHNADRLGRLPGTYNRKGAHSADRPHRLARNYYGPESDVLDVADPSVLLDFCSYVEALTSVKVTAPLTPPPEISLDTESLQSLIEELQSWLMEHGSPPIRDVRDDGSKTVLTFAHCPFRGPAHTDGDAAVIVYRSGGIGFKCFHEKCGQHDWRALQERLGATFRSATMIDHATERRSTLIRSFRDPLALAQTFYDRNRHDDGAPGYAFVHCEMYRYLPAGWRSIPQRELNAPVRDTIQSVFDLEFRRRSDLKYPPHVKSADITNVVRALESVAYVQIDPTTSPPFWLTPVYDSDPLDLLVTGNGILDFRRWLEGEECFFPRTSHLFVEAIGDFDYDPARLYAPHWTDFLASLNQDAKWVECLQQIMGACLWAGYDLQKLFMLVGPPRCGKGTITRTLEGLLGRQNVCSPNLIDFAKPFGLEQALGKRLAVVPEVAFPPRDAQQVVATLKAISGGDMVTVDRKHIKNIPVRLPMKIMLVTNNFVALPDNSKALPSRLIPLRFTESFLNKEDLSLGTKLAAERPAILNWSMAGLRSLYCQDGRFTLPASTLEMMELMQYESAPLQSFVEEACVLDPRKGVYKQSLYDTYKRWCLANDMDHKLLSTSDFNTQLMSAVPQVTGKRPSSRDHQQSTYTVVSTDFDQRITSGRPEVWVGIYCRQLT